MNLLTKTIILRVIRKIERKQQERRKAVIYK